MGQTKRYGILRGTRLQSSSPKQEAVCSDNALWETWTKRWSLEWRFHSKDYPRKKSAFPMNSVVNLFFRRRLKQDSSASDSGKKTKFST